MDSPLPTFIDNRFTLPTYTRDGPGPACPSYLIEEAGLAWGCGSRALLGEPGTAVLACL